MISFLMSAPAGRVLGPWRLWRGPAGGEDLLRLRWAEAGGPPVAGPSELGRASVYRVLKERERA